MALFERPQPELGTEGDVLKERIGAFLIDLALYVVVLGTITGVLFAGGARAVVLTGQVGLVVFILYTLYFEAEYGQTVGKRAMGIVVITEDGNPLTYRESAIRNVLRILDGIPGIFHVVGLLAVMLTNRNQRIGDVVADTVVVQAKDRGERL